MCFFVFYVWIVGTVCKPSNKDILRALLQIGMDPARKEEGPLLPGKICCTFQPAGTSCSCLQQTCRQSSSLPY